VPVHERIWGLRRDCRFQTGRFGAAGTRNIRAVGRGDDCQSESIGEHEDRRENTADLPRKTYTRRLMSLRPEEIEKERCTEDSGAEYAAPNVEAASTHVVVVMHQCFWIHSLDGLLLINEVGQYSSGQGLGEHAEDQSALVDNELGSSKVIGIIPHVRALEFRPFDLGEVESPDHWRHDMGKQSLIWMR